MFEQRRKVEEEYASAAYSQLLTFVELFEFYIGCQQPDLVVPLRIDECATPCRIRPPLSASSTTK